MKGKIEGPMGVIEFDSTKPGQDSNNPQAQMITSMYKAMTGNELVMKMSPKGDIVAIEGFDAMMDKMALEQFNFSCSFYSCCGFDCRRQKYSPYNK